MARLYLTIVRKEMSKVTFLVISHQDAVKKGFRQ